MIPRLTLSIIAVLSLAILPLASPRAEGRTAETEIRAVLLAQTQAWNAGDIDLFMEGYAKRDDIRFASGSTVQRGWQATLERYKRSYPDRAAMGKLSFSDLEFDQLADDAVLVFGRYTLERANDRPTGLFTLLFKKFGDDWRIVADHTSSGS